MVEPKWSELVTEVFSIFILSFLHLCFSWLQEKNKPDNIMIDYTVNEVRLLWSAGKRRRSCLYTYPAAWSSVSDQIQRNFLKYASSFFPAAVIVVQARHLWKSGDQARSWGYRRWSGPEAIQAIRLKIHREFDEHRKWPGIRSAVWGWSGGWKLDSTIPGGLSHRYRVYFR